MGIDRTMHGDTGHQDKSLDTGGRFGGPQQIPRALDICGKPRAKLTWTWFGGWS